MHGRIYYTATVDDKMSDDLPSYYRSLVGILVVVGRRSSDRTSTAAAVDAIELLNYHGSPLHQDIYISL
jgi:hypothetical protein